ncbi:pentatricopeptide repeat-containing protein At1g74600, chloroplastic [Ricinus communis]|uniref:pentatricopeptide repeat-containing protein At1g74600, chloroplastic n=1 Tax=Ricinus communis TaxID=3988 RepID=UPI0007726438|nr:pentatricopeptide repeat-containing protein At1g74600, chloroplastic [Ricinus communis]XP_015579481.1 pentatricopeptide repeat-containing protein At1g74600, chloroplastic [Ricinus communis]XP_025014323.1 pentatricopeptide repeat-containing protein At1g74600, chloroplastic [Ricinus communis]|eukprot:XP_015579478.1 pentatricopeptide repeat-containing protein At1g74600, chloroplastic [Ricinus communis]
MYFLINQNLQTKIIPISFSKFISSLPIFQNSSFTKPIKYEQEEPPSFLDPFHFFTNYIKSADHTVEETKVIHTHLIKTALFNSNTVVANSLLDWYCKSGALFYALKVFDTIPNKNVISWNVIISGYNRNSLFEDSWRFFSMMHFSGFDPNDITYGCVLSACAALETPNLGEQVYSLATKNGFYSNGHVRAGMIDLLARNGRFGDALRVFYDVSCENVVCWNSIISGAVKSGEYWIALDIFYQMSRRFVVPNSFTFSSILTACASLEEVELGKGIQGWVIKCCAKDIFVGTAIVNMYAKCGDIVDAVKEFSRMPVRNVVSWTAIVSGFIKRDDSISALKFFKEMRKMKEETNKFTVTTVISACAKPHFIKEAIQIHCWILKTGYYLDPVVGAALINMYAKLHAISSSEMVFREMEGVKNPGIWTIMISSFAKNQDSQSAIDLLLKLLQQGLRPDKFCLSSVLSVIDSLYLGREIHCYILKTGFVLDLSVGSSLFTMYSKCGSIGDSYKVFEQIPVKDNISWTSMISGFTEHGHAYQAFELLRKMLTERSKPDQTTFSAILSAASSIHSLQKGKEIHGYAYRARLGDEALVGGALVNMYSKCGALESARKMFDLLAVKDQVSCSSLVSGYAQNGWLEEALLLFHEMLISNFTIDSFAVSSVLGAIAGLNRLDFGTQLHAHLVKLGLDSDVSVGSSLVTVYSKCGSIEDCWKAFNQIDDADLISWTTMIASCAQHGKGVEALKIYEQMRREGIRPDSVTFVGVLSACSHANLVEEGYFHFNSMTKDFGLEPNNRHYACMVDLLGRSGRLKEAEKFIRGMPIDPDALVWATLLAACKLHGDIELGKIAAKKVMELNPNDDGAYVLLSNIFADAGQWEGVVQIRSLMSGTGVRKEAAWSFM